MIADCRPPARGRQRRSNQRAVRARQPHRRPRRRTPPAGAALESAPGRGSCPTIPTGCRAGGSPPGPWKTAWHGRPQAARCPEFPRSIALPAARPSRSRLASRGSLRRSRRPRLRATSSNSEPRPRRLERHCSPGGWAQLGCWAAWPRTPTSPTSGQQRRSLNYTNSRRVILITTGPRACID